MKLLPYIALFSGIAGCNPSANNPGEKTSNISADSMEAVHKKNKLERESKPKTLYFVKSTYDDTAFASRVTEHRAKLKNLYAKKVFSTLHEALLPKLQKANQAYFNRRKELNVLAYVNGALYGSDTTDAAFVLYNADYTCISIMVYNAADDTYHDLYRDVGVQNGLKDAGCNYYSFGTIDYQLADELILQSSELINNPLNYLEFVPLKITNIEKDETFLIDQGCISKAFIKEKKALCVSTSMVYNNWECLQYNKTYRSFAVVYGQAFAD